MVRVYREGVLDYTVRVSSREAYVSPSRGQQGNALKCMIAMPFALDGTHGTAVIESGGQAHRIVFDMDPVRREPRILREIASSDVQSGTRMTVRWPQTACHLLEAARDRFVQMVCGFTTFNPHLTLRGIGTRGIRQCPRDRSGLAQVANLRADKRALVRCRPVRTLHGGAHRAGRRSRQNRAHGARFHQ
jgi:hypothetical protein